MDESALFWKMSPDAILAISSSSGVKRDKARITINLYCNVTGEEKLPPWFIGKAINSWCFGRQGVRADNLDMVWRNNKKGWMTGVIF